ncbi:MAG TPA: hypothetical protein VF627_00605 [Abditibacterium sp.]
MLIVALLGAFLFYVGLYLIWTSMHVRLDSVNAVLGALNEMLWAPESLVFTIFRGLIIAGTFYVVADFLVSGAKRLARRRSEHEKNALSWKRPPRI